MDKLKKVATVSYTDFTDPGNQQTIATELLAEGAIVWGAVVYVKTPFAGVPDVQLQVGTMGNTVAFNQGVDGKIAGQTLGFSPVSFALIPIGGGSQYAAVTCWVTEGYDLSSLTAGEADIYVAWSEVDA